MQRIGDEEKGAPDRRRRGAAVARPRAEAQPMSAVAYAAMALIAMAIGFGLLVLFVYEAPRLDPATRSQVFYIVLLPSATACAAALFGAMRGYARLTHRHFGVKTELSGPVVLFVLVVWGGHKLVPAVADSFDLTVRAHAADGSVARITSGMVLLELGRESRKASFDSDGDADFKAIPQRFMGTGVTLLPKVDGYQTASIQTSIHGPTLEISLERPGPIVFRGSVEDEDANPLPGVDVMSPDCDQQGKTNERGVFVFRIPSEGRTQCRFVFRKLGFATYSTDLSLDASDHKFALQRAH
jgi:hypothetical protein